MKHIYLIRHGETEANKARMHQTADEPLTAKGRLQAHHIAHVLAEKKIDVLVCSPYVRARETAHIIGEQVSLPYTTEESLVEVKRPDHLYGQNYYSPQTLFYMWKLFTQREHQKWDYNGAENMFALRNRIKDAKRMLANVEGESIAAVSHDVFMNLFLAHTSTDKKLSFAQFVRVLLMSKKTPNTGIMHFEYDERAPKGVSSWRLIELIQPYPKSRT